MTASTLTQLPLAAGGAIASSLGRAGMWTLARYMRAPVASTGLLAMVTLTALAGSNALYFQTARHPAPLFQPAPNVPLPVEAEGPTIAPLAAPEPVERTAVAPEPPPVETTGSVSQPAMTPVVAAPQAVVPAEPVGNAEVFELQKKLLEMGLFQGTVDGYYGPMTARAIRTFEERSGREPTGALNRDVVDAILGAEAGGLAPVAQPAIRMASIAPAPTPVQVQPVAAVQAAPDPIQTQAVAPLAPVQDRVVQRLPPVSPVEEAFDSVAETAETTIDSILAAVDGGREAPPPPANKPIPAMPLLAQPAPQPQPPAVVATERVAATQIAPASQPMPPAVVAMAPQVDQTVPQTNLAPANDPALVSEIQRGLASLGFLVGPIDGKPGEATAKAIRSFEVFHNYEMTGQITPQLPGLLREAGATI